MFKEIAIKGSLGMTKRTVLDAVDLCAGGRIKPVITNRFSLEEINEAARMLDSGEILGRAVLIP
jgi:D-arabinose 1-dehydrogenase-like Zn-dependent alcohol dehydrogenase